VARLIKRPSLLRDRGDLVYKGASETPVEMDTSRFHAPLEPQDTERQTLGCRHAKPDFCSKNCMEDVCAHVRRDGICTSPPMSWPKQFRRLKVLGDGALSPAVSTEGDRGDAIVERVVAETIGP
jgi:hypothetical protein